MEASLLGTAVGNIRVVDRLARGGTGEVYVGRDLQLGRKVALKAIRPRYRLNQDAKARLLREARILSRLDHPNICRIYDYLTTSERDFLVLELIQGKNLRQRILEGIEPHLAMSVALQLAEVLAAAHGQGVIHRDLKPENVMLTAEGRVKVLDFGLARAQEGDLTATLSGSALGPYETTTEPWEELPEEVRTRLGRVLGTVGYMSPEQAQGHPVTSASDMYSLGLLLQELFTGRRSFEETSDPRQQLLRTVNSEILPMTGAGLDADLQALIERLQSATPPARPSASETAERLRYVRDKPRRRRRRLLTWGAAVFLALSALVMIWQSTLIRREIERADREAARVRQVADFLTGIFAIPDSSLDPDAFRRTRELLDRSTDKARRELGEVVVRAKVLGALADSYRRLAFQADVMEELDAEPLYRQALALREEALGADHPEVAESLRDLARHCRARGRIGEAEAALRRAAEITLGDP